MQSFYASSLGGVARRHLRERVRERWPHTRGDCVLGLGYATPFLRPFLTDGARVSAIMPAEQGGTRWPGEGLNVCAIADEEALPYDDESVDRLLLVHAAEAAARPAQMLRECWRVIAPEGRLMVIVPHRRSLWAGLDRTPFGHGRSFSEGQLDRLLTQSLFEPVWRGAALWFPPTVNRMTLGAAPAIDKLGARWFGALSGALMAEAKKSVYGVTPLAPATRARRLVFSPVPAHGAPARVRPPETRPHPRPAPAGSSRGSA